MKSLMSSFRILACVLLLVSGTSSATSVEIKSLEELVPEADEIVVATITSVEVVDAKGRLLQGKQARTGPGLSNQMRFRLQVEEVMYSCSGVIPATLVVPLWRMWHYDLDSMQREVLGERGIFLLKAGMHEPVYPGYFQRSLDERGEIEALLPLVRTPR